MASIRRIDGKNGTSYKITVSSGRDSKDRQIRYYKTWTPEKPMTDRQMEKEVQRVAFEFERQIEQGLQADNRQTFEQYANYFIQMQEQNGSAKNTIELYRRLMKRLSPAIGHMKLKDIRPQHISALNRELAREGIRQEPSSAQPKDNFRETVYRKFSSQREMSRACGVHPSILCECCNGQRVLLKTAEKMCSALGEDVSSLFEIITPSAPLAGNTLSHFHSFVTSVLRQAEREMLIPYNPALKVDPPKVGKKEPNYFQPETVERIINALENEPIRWRTMIHIFLVTGCRRGEVLALRWENVDFENRLIRIDSSASYFPKEGIVIGKTKTRQVRYIPFSEDTARILKEYRKAQIETRLQMGGEWSGGNFVFTRENGEPVFPATLASWLNAFSKRHDLPHINPHSFRHTAASILIAEGVDVVTVSKMLGHASTSITTDVYSHMIEAAERRAAECVSDVILGKMKA